MNITVINIKDLIKCVVILCILVIILVAGVKVVMGKEEFESAETESNLEDSSFLYCLEMELPIMANEEEKKETNDNTLGNSYKILDSGLAMFYNINENKEQQENLENEINEEGNNEVQTQEEETIDRKIDENTHLETAVISENNIEASFTNSEQDIKVKNQSKYDINDILKDNSYELKNKNKVIIYHTHTCESYTSSEKYNYEMTGTYRTTDLNYTVSAVRR